MGVLVGTAGIRGKCKEITGVRIRERIRNSRKRKTLL